ncbi:hypothetical protein M407DRAFT_4246 [Tulasnella calospora MUT 4182]|uniref:Uncharacterized protein n=1 Tax=Tulasnella calospora MUT 4182 TaxID=1051891 RepID=A0A0C3MH45_9AGAM|nr:hypothetical protein M407DRAFT_4246 [Tulasnella calospora MUT 4182]
MERIGFSTNHSLGEGKVAWGFLSRDSEKTAEARRPPMVRTRRSELFGAHTYDVPPNRVLDVGAFGRKLEDPRQTRIGVDTSSFASYDDRIAVSGGSTDLPKDVLALKVWEDRIKDQPRAPES